MNLPKLKAEFVLDENGKPKAPASGNYLIRLSLSDVPDDAHRVTYQLDPTYYDPLREVRDPAHGFREELTSYGNYLIQAKIRTRDHSLSTSRDLYEALTESHAGSTDETVQNALRDIKDN